MVHSDRVVMPFFNVEEKTQFWGQGICYGCLPEEDRERYKEGLGRTQELKGARSCSLKRVKWFVFKSVPVDETIQDLMEGGIGEEGGEGIGSSALLAPVSWEYFVEGRS